jgi:hypothetical protein
VCMRARFPEIFAKKGKGSIYSLDEFKWGWSIIFSRAFDIEVPTLATRERQVHIYSKP